MLPLIYFLKVMLCSAAFLSYYVIVLRNKKIHRFNRFYLLFSVAASWLVPLLKFEVPSDQIEQQPVYQAFTYIAQSNTEFEAAPIQEIASSFNWMQLIPVLYFVVAGVILIALLISIGKIYRIYKKYPKQKFENVVLISTKENGTPFSFFNYIFWNTEIDTNSTAGKNIWQHELTHVKDKHSLDKLFIQLNIVFGWFNPCFWLIKRELEMIHEFIADHKAIPNSSAADFASMLLAAAFPAPKYELINPLLFSPIKRRLTMLTQNKNPKFTYMRKLIVLPFLALVVLLFGFRNRENSMANSTDFAKGTTLLKNYRVVLDAGHGGMDPGCKSSDATVYEKDINLAIVKAIRQLNTNQNIEIILTREYDRFDDLKAKANFINNQKADLSVSIHCSDAGKDDRVNGTEIYVVNSDKNNSFMNESHSLAQSVNGSLKSNFVNRGIKTQQKGIWILNAAQCPAILIEAGFLSNKDDAAMLMNADKQELMANSILKGIENYLALKERR